ncbi:MAG: hypothetical protein SPJ89_04100 [Treponema sp.]|nr:hypothetical protein [Spirochaetia bacterium]MDD7460624.1 hypothetical protein [Spirochaetales bacterium]MDY5811140.1 hypothetical protein [Treponema sp.]
MIYPFMTLNDETEIVHSEMNKDGKVKVYMETPDEKLCFKHATCWLPENEWTDIYGYSDKELEHLKDVVTSEAYLIIEFAQNGGFDNT